MNNNFDTTVRKLYIKTCFDCPYCVMDANKVAFECIKLEKERICWEDEKIPGVLKSCPLKKVPFPQEKDMDIPKMQVEIPVAWEIDAVDYHCFDEYKYILKKFGFRAHFTEVGFDGRYHAVFFL